MGYPDVARATVTRSLDSCIQADINGRMRLAVIRAELLREGFEHRDTPAFCRELGFTLVGLTVLTPTEAAARA